MRTNKIINNERIRRDRRPIQVHVCRVGSIYTTYSTEYRQGYAYPGNTLIRELLLSSTWTCSFAREETEGKASAWPWRESAQSRSWPPLRRQSPVRATPQLQPWPPQLPPSLLGRALLVPSPLPPLLPPSPSHRRRSCRLPLARHSPILWRHDPEQPPPNRVASAQSTLPAPAGAIAPPARSKRVVRALLLDVLAPRIPGSRECLLARRRSHGLSVFKFASPSPLPRHAAPPLPSQQPL